MRLDSKVWFPRRGDGQCRELELDNHWWRFEIVVATLGEGEFLWRQEGDPLKKKAGLGAEGEGDAEMIERKWWLDSGLLIHFVFVWTRPFPWNFEEMARKRSEVNLGVREIIFPPKL